MKWRDGIKPLFDRAAAIVFIVVLSPLLLLASVLIKLDSTGPVLFRQTRIGEHQRCFEILKFRTMVISDNRPEAQTFSNSDGVTRVGKYLRRFKIDELPQLFNVLRGDMSIVGPRPCLPSALDIIDERSKLRFSIKPGLTGLAQVNGNVCIDWSDRWKYDVFYVQHLTLAMDSRIILKTVLVVYFGEERFKRLFDNENSSNRVG